MKRILAPVAAGLGILLVAISAPAVANAATLTATTTQAQSVDQASFTRGLAIESDGQVADVSITIDFTMEAPFYYDAMFQLTSPQGTTVTLVRSASNQPGSYGSGNEGNADAQVTFRDDAAALVSGRPTTGTFRPWQPLAAFDGQSAGGTWTLTVADTLFESTLHFRSATLSVVEAVPVLVAGDLPPAAEGVAYEGQLPAATAAGAVTYAAASPAALPPGLTLASTGAITGTPTTSGVYDFAVTATDAIGTSQPRTYTIVVEGAPTISGAASANATVGTAFSYAPVVDDGELPTTITADGLPNGLTVDPTTGVISGTPADTARSNYGVVLTATNARGTDEHSVVIRLAAGPVATLTLAPDGSRIAENAVIDFTTTAVDAGGNAVAADGVTLSTDGTNDVVTGLSVVFGDPGQRTVTATHGATGVTDTVTVTVLPAPVVPDGELPVARVGVAYEAVVPAAVAEGDDVTYALADGSALPAGLALASDGTIDGTPTAFGVVAFDVTATDEFGTSEPRTLEIEVQAPPVITGPDAAIATRGDVFAYEPALIVGQPAATVTADGLPDGLVVDAATGAISGTPTDAPGEYVVALTATNVVGSDDHEVTIDLAPGSIAELTLTPESDRVSQSGTLDFTVTAVDDGGYPTPYAGDVTLSTGVEGDVVAEDQASIVFGEPGMRTVTATSASTGEQATASVEVIAPPTLADATLPDAIVGDTYEATLPEPTATGAYTYEIVDAGEVPAGLEVSEDGVVSGIPTMAGAADFQVVVTDKFGTSDIASFDIAVLERASITGEATATAPIGSDFAYVPALEPGDPAATVTTLEPLPEWLELDAATGALTGTPTGALGEIAVTLVADNGLGASQHGVVIDVVPGAVASLALTPSATTVDQGGSVTIDVAASDVEGNAVVLAEGDVELVSDVVTDVVDGLTVAFPTASPHTITATHVTTGVTAEVVVEVVPSPTVVAPTPSAPGVAPAPTASDLPTTGVDGGPAGALLAIAAMLLVAGFVVGMRRRA